MLRKHPEFGKTWTEVQTDQEEMNVIIKVEHRVSKCDFFTKAILFYIIIG